MDRFDQPSNGIRELAAGLEDVMFGPGGYQWFLENNARIYAQNTRRSQPSRPAASVTRKGLLQPETRPVQESAAGKISAETPASQGASSTKLKKKPRNTRPTSPKPPSESGTINLTSSSNWSPSSTDVDDSNMKVEEEIDELESTTDEMPEERTPSLNSSTSHAYPPQANESSPSFPLTRVRPRVSDGSVGQRRVVNRMYVELPGPRSPRKRSITKEAPERGNGMDIDM